MIDKVTAFTIAGNNYRLCDKEGKEYRIDSAHGYFFKVQDDGIVKNIYFGDIGTIYFILAHPMENLTKEINGVIHLVELAKIAFPKHDWFHVNSKNVVTEDKEKGFEYDGRDFEFYSMNDGKIFPAYNQLELFNYLNKNHFSHFLPEGSWLPIKL